VVKLVTFWEQLAAERDTLVEGWCNRVLDTYPPDAARLMRRERDRFQNPVGWTIRQTAEALFDELLAGVRRDRVTPHLESLLKIRAVQDYAPSQTCALFFLLKSEVRQRLAPALRRPAAAPSTPAPGPPGRARELPRELPRELLEFESRVDALALVAFDVYMACRERLFEIKAADAGRRAALLLERAQDYYDGLVAAGPPAPGAAVADGEDGRGSRD
jgi:hypothetical protein